MTKDMCVVVNFKGQKLLGKWLYSAQQCGHQIHLVKLNDPILYEGQMRDTMAFAPNQVSFIGVPKK